MLYRRIGIKKIKTRIMTKRFCIIIFISVIFPVIVKSQDITEFLKHVSMFNPEILAYKKLLEAKKAEARTGITPPDPFVNFGFMPGNTEEIGTKRTWSVTQSFSFPTKYILRNKLSRSSIALAEKEFNLGVLNTMLNAKLLLYEFIYNLKTLELLSARKEVYDKLKSGWGTMLASGEATVLEYNKIILELSSMNLRINRVETNISILKEKLRYISGNNIELPSISNYLPSELPDYERLITEKSEIHPAFLLPESEYQVSLQEVRLSRAGSLPEFQAGVASEIIPGETYTGPVAGFTIPLWSNSNKIKTAVFMAEHSAASRDATLLELRTTVRGEFENMTALRKSISEIKEIIESGRNKEYLEKALAAGEISLTDFFIFLETSFRAEDRLCELEYEYNKSLALLYDHDLLK